MPKTIALPTGVTPAAAAAAAITADHIGKVLAGSETAAAAHITKRYGKDVKRATLALAARAASELAGLVEPSRGGARANVLAVRTAMGDALAAVLATVDDTADMGDVHAAAWSESAFITAAAARMAENAAVKKAAADKLAAVRKVVNSTDNTVTLAERTAALGEWDSITAATLADKETAARARFDAALLALVEIVGIGYAVESVSTLAATLAAPVEPVKSVSKKAA